MSNFANWNYALAEFAKKQEKEKQDILKEILDLQKKSMYRFKFKKSHKIKIDKR